MKKVLAKIMDFTGMAIIILIIVLCLAITGPRVFGITAYTVMTGSMEPNIPVGSVIYVSRTDPAGLEEGDVIVFYNGRNEVPITHRVVENRTESREIVTKGDANESVDLTPIPYGNVIGIVRLHIPFIGRFLSLLGTNSGKLSLIALALGGSLLCMLARGLQKPDPKRKGYQGGLDRNEGYIPRHSK